MPEPEFYTLLSGYWKWPKHPWMIRCQDWANFNEDMSIIQYMEASHS